MNILGFLGNLGTGEIIILGIIGIPIVITLLLLWRWLWRLGNKRNE